MSIETKYKNTGIPYCPQIPESWSVKRLKFVGKSIIGITYNPTQVTDAENGKLVLRSSNVQNGVLSFEDNVYVNTEVSEKHLSKEGDILICARNGSAHLVGKCAIIPKEYEGLTFGSFMLMFRSDLGKFMYYVFNSNLFKSQTGLYKTSTINQLTSDTINNLFVALPSSKEEQNKIAHYLDSKTVEIDNLISKKQKLIDCLNEERVSTIQQSVTKGLDVNVEMQDTGVDWLGGIPKKWSYKRLKYIVTIETGNKNTEDREEEGAYPFFVRSQTIKKSSEYQYDREAVLTAGDGVGVGKVFHYINGKFSCHQRVYIFSNFKYVTGKYFYYYFSSNLNLLVQTWNAKTTVDSLRLPILQSMLIAIPSIKEQVQIIEFIEQETSKIDNTINKIEREIELIKEYRASLINDLVTGKILLN